MKENNIINDHQDREKAKKIKEIADKKLKRDTSDSKREKQIQDNIEKAVKENKLEPVPEPIKGLIPFEFFSNLCTVYISLYVILLHQQILFL